MRKIITFITIIGIGVAILFFYYSFKNNLFSDPKVLKEFIKSFGVFGVAIFILLQIIQPIIPIIPGGLSDVAGILMYGNFLGLLYVSLGLVIGELILFLLVRRYGKSILQSLLSEKSIRKVDNFTTNGKVTMQKLIIVIFLIPFGPDDLICIAAGLSDISLKRYFWTIAILKPISVGIHCFIMISVLKVV